MTVVKHMSLGVYASPHVHNAFIEAIEGLRVSLGSGIILNYLFQGLFHSARKVRTVYWKVYNILYVGSQDGLIPSYPIILDDEMNSYCRTELNYFI